MGFQARRIFASVPARRAWKPIVLVCANKKPPVKQAAFFIR